MTRRLAWPTATASLVIAAWGAAAHAQQPSASEIASAQGALIAERTMQDLYPPGPGGLDAAAVNDVIIAEGDSWFSYPGLDVLSALESRLSGGVRYGIFSAAKAGDTVEAMAYDGEQLKGFAREFKKVRDAGRAGQVRAILLSGGGNDIAGREFHVLLNHARSVAGANAPLDHTLSSAFLDRLIRNIQSLIGTAARFSRDILGRSDIPILIHGYAAPVPDGRPDPGGGVLHRPVVRPVVPPHLGPGLPRLVGDAERRHQRREDDVERHARGEHVVEERGTEGARASPGGTNRHGTAPAARSAAAIRPSVSGIHAVPSPRHNTNHRSSQYRVSDILSHTENTRF